MGKSTDLSRAERKAKKRALEDSIPDLPGDNDAGPEEVEKPEKKSKKRKRDGEEDAIEEGKKEKKEKKEKKKRRKTEEEGGDEVVEEKVEKKEKKIKEAKKAAAKVEEDTVMAEAEDGELPKKSKKERKAERKAREAAESAEKAPATESTKEAPETNGEAGEAEKKSKKNNRNREKKRKGTSANGEAADSDGDGEDKKAARFIVFIGNLPFSATTASITSHFAKVHPTSVRHLTKKEDPSKSRGIAFLEFSGYDHMKTCLKLFHHSMFDDKISPPRKINVELTVGGGGNTKDRKEKIKEKNEKLNEQRFRRIQEEEKAKLEKKSEGKPLIDESAIHPSRRGRVPIV